MLHIAMATIRLKHLQGLKMKWVTLNAYNTTSKANVVQFGMHLHYNIDNACKYIVFVNCLY